MINVVYESCGYFKAKSLGINRLIDVRGLLRDLTHVVYLVEDSAGMLESLGFDKVSEELEGVRDSVVKLIDDVVNGLDKRITEEMWRDEYEDSGYFISVGLIDVSKVKERVKELMDVLRDYVEGLWESDYRELMGEKGKREEYEEAVKYLIGAYSLVKDMYKILDLITTET